MAQLEIGAVLRCVNGETVKVEQLLGEGGQGFVYRVSYNGKPMAMKWYKPEKVNNLDWFDQNLKRNISRGAPAPTFLWPVAMTNRVDDTFGYIMPLRPSNFCEFDDLLVKNKKTGKMAEFDKFAIMIDAALNIVSGFRILHREGYTYQDLNNGNFFVDIKNGDVLICDNDNVAAENSGIGGKAGYMAPLVVTGDTMPNKYTDRFSMAVILFILFMRSHPLEGAAVLKYTCLTEAYQRLCYGTNPIFVLDPTDQSNCPVEPHHHNIVIRWPLMPESIKALFIKAFSKKAMLELNSPEMPIELSWCRALLQYRSDLIYCPHCGRQIILDHNKPICMHCQKKVHVPFYLKAGHVSVPAVNGVELLEEHIADFASEKYDHTVIGEIITAKNDSSVYGLRNLSNSVWRYRNDENIDVDVGKNEVIHLVKGRRIKINGKEILVQ